MKAILFSLMLMSVAFLSAQEVEPIMVDVHYSPDDVQSFDANQAVSNSSEFKAVVANDPCILTLVLKDMYFNAITKEDLNSPNSMSYIIKLENAEVFDNDFIKLGCTSNAFSRWNIMKRNNYKLLNSLK